MRIELKRGTDGPSSLACVRDDGSRTWSRVHPFLPEHDLTHCAVESVLGLDRAFFGLIAGGWGIDDFARPGAARSLPADAVVAEHVVGMFDRERAAGTRLSAGEFNDALALALRGAGVPPYRALGEDDLAAIRALRAALITRWWATGPGFTLTIPFPARLTPAASKA